MILLYLYTGTINTTTYLCPRAEGKETENELKIKIKELNSISRAITRS